MAGVFINLNTAAIATGTSIKTLAQLIAAANHRVLVWEWSIAFKGSSNTAAPILVRVLRQTTGGTMSALTLTKNNMADDETVQTTAQHTATAEPTASEVVHIEHVHPQTGFTWQAPYNRPIVVIGSARLGIDVTAGADVNAVVHMSLEE